jgi:hypothetical protein
MSSLASEVGAYEDEHLRELASRPNTTVLQVGHDRVQDPWPVTRLRPLMETLVARVLAFGDDVDDFRVRKDCLDDPEVLEFYRAHPKLYYMMTDRKLMGEERCRSAITGLLHVRDKVETGALEEGRDADAMATRSVLAALGASHVTEQPPSSSARR